MNHLATSNGFETAIGSFQTGGAYSGPKHSMRWEDCHPIWDDKQWTATPPPGCGSSVAPDSFDALSAAHYNSDMCDSSKWLNNTEMQCGDGAKFPSGIHDPASCCAACAADPKCTHWVFNKNGNQTKDERVSKSRGPCHVKYGKTCKGGDKAGYTAGLGHAPQPGPSPPGPSPLGPAQCTNEYSTDLWGSLALQAVTNHNTSKTDNPLYLHLCFQAVHTPYDAPQHHPEALNTYQSMVWDADIWVGRIVAKLKEKQMWDNTFIVYSADNGGVGDGINYPLRGEKHSNWEGGMRTAAFVSGGLIPTHLRGTTNGVNMHIVDWLVPKCFCPTSLISWIASPPPSSLYTCTHMHTHIPTHTCTHVRRV